MRHCLEVRILRVWKIASDTDHSAFPDALEFGHSKGRDWVEVPRSSISHRFRRTVTGLWRGAEVDVWELHASGWHEGKVTLAYEGSSPEEALALGFRGDQYMGWYVAADPAEVEVTDVTITERPLKAGS